MQVNGMASTTSSKSTQAVDGAALWKAAERVLTQSDKNKLLCVLLHSDLTFNNVNWDEVTTTWGAKNVKTMRTIVAQTVKKIKDEAAQPSDGKEALQEAPKSQKRGAANDGMAKEKSRKRSKVKAEPVGDGDESQFVVCELVP